MLSGLVALLFTIYEWLLIIRIFMSWFRPNVYHPAIRLLLRVTDPVLEPARRMIPPAGAIDFSPVLVLLVLGWVRTFVVRTLWQLGL